VDAAPGVEALGREPGRRAVRVAPDEHLAASLLGPAFEPPADATGRRSPADRDDPTVSSEIGNGDSHGAVRRDAGLGQRAVLQPRV
jgi:hypothetical protein